MFGAIAAGVGWMGCWYWFVGLYYLVRIRVEDGGVGSALSGGGRAL